MSLSRCLVNLRHTHTPHRMHIHCKAELFSQVSLLLFTVSPTFRSFRTVAFEVWGNLHKSLGESQYFLVMPTCCSPARLLGPCAYLMELLNYRLTMGLSFLHWPQHSGTHWTMEQRNTSAKPNLYRAEGYRGVWLGPASPLGVLCSTPVIIIVNYARSRESRKLRVDFMKMN